jgi:toxin-antitoxin system PIN domain toxin
MNLLVFASNEEASEQSRAIKFLEEREQDPDLFCLTWPVLCGYQRIVTHPSIFRNPLNPEEAWANVRDLLAWPRVRVLGEEESFAEDFGAITGKLAVRGNGVPDAQVATILRQHGVNRMYSTDADFRKFSFLEVINPLER